MEIFTLELGPCATNTYLIADNGVAIVVDPSCDAEYISSFAESKGANIKLVLVTHAHFDHIGAVGELQRLGAEVYISSTDYELIDFDNNDMLFGTNTFFGADRFVKDGDEFMFADRSFKVVATPGHTPGGVCYIMDGRYIFSGDTLFRCGIGRTDFPFGSYAELISSVNKLFALDGEFEVLPGHGEKSTLDYERKNNPYV